MRRTTVIALFLIANICALQWTDIQTRVDALTTLKNGKAIQPVKGFMPKDNTVPCSTCVSFFDDSLNDILNILLNLGIGAGCNDLCGNLTSTVEQGMCLLLCVLVGFDGFVTILENEDLDPIHICVELDACAANACLNDCTEITALTVTPNSGPLRTTFSANIGLEVFQTVGAGITAVVIHTHGAPSIEYDQLNSGFNSGTYNYTIPIETDWEDWNYPIGNYTVEVYSCAEDCDNDHGVVFSSANTTFQITSDMKIKMLN